MTTEQRKQSLEALKRDYFAEIAKLRAQGRKLSCLQSRCDILIARIDATKAYAASVQKIARG